MDTLKAFLYLKKTRGSSKRHATNLINEFSFLAFSYKREQYWNELAVI